ncbi:MAG: hypothetical protein AABZ73_08820 [Pseudomonadota bacterium]|uniref:hypothetical protein n=1 Tax=Sphingobium sp. TaxID=1912891 RepID=UPI002E1B5192
MLRTLALVAGAALGWKYATQAGDSPLPDALSAQDDPGHTPADLLTDAHPDGAQRAEDHYRPDPTAPVSAEDRESLRPVTMPAPHDPPGR